MTVCGACGLSFTGVTAFDAHRVGKHAYTITEGLAMDPPRDDGRRCLTTWEMEERGFAENERGRWGQVKSRVRAAERFLRDTHPVKDDEEREAA